MVLVAAGLVAERNTACFQKHTCQSRSQASWMGLSPSRHSVNTVSVRISNSVPCGLGRPPWSPTPWSPLAGALAPSCTLQRRCRWLCSAPSCSGTYVRAAQAAPTPRSSAGLVAPCFKVLHRAYPCGRARASAPLPTASEGPGAQPTLAQAPAFSEHGLETDAINKGFFTVHSAMGRRPPLCFTVHSVMGRRPTLSTQ